MKEEGENSIGTSAWEWVKWDRKLKIDCSCCEFTCTKLGRSEEEKNEAEKWRERGEAEAMQRGNENANAMEMEIEMLPSSREDRGLEIKSSLIAKEQKSSKLNEGRIAWWVVVRQGRGKGRKWLPLLLNVDVAQLQSCNTQPNYSTTQQMSRCFNVWLPWFLMESASTTNHYASRSQFTLSCSLTKKNSDATWSRMSQNYS